jgi:chromosome segregation ATPase
MMPSTRSFRATGGVAEQAKTEKDKQKTRVEDALKKHVDQHGADDDLLGHLAESENTYSAKKVEVDDSAAKLKELRADQAQPDAERAGRALKNTEAERDKLREEQIRLETTLTTKDLVGLHERLDEARSTKHAADEELRRWLRRAEATKLLYETLSQCQDQARSRYLAPLHKQVHQLLPILFPNAKGGLRRAF